MLPSLGELGKSQFNQNRSDSRLKMLRQEFRLAIPYKAQYIITIVENFMCDRSLQG